MNAGINWKSNLRIVWLGTFITGLSFSLVMPFMVLYVEQLGETGHSVELYSGLAVAITPLGSGLMAPFWGKLADRYGRKPMMMRASFFMAFTMGSLFFVSTVYWLLFLRLMNGMLGGYVANAEALIASQVPPEKSGYALGMLATGFVTGTLLGPSFGGFLAELVGIRNVFLLVGILLFILFLLTTFVVKENFIPVTKEESMSFKEVLHNIKHTRIMLGLFVTTMVIQISTKSLAPILALYIRHLGQKENLMFVSGVIVSAVGLSSIMSSGFLGRLGDRIGNHRLLLIALLYTGSLYFVMTYARTPFELGLLRFLFGFGTGALLPSVSALLNKLTPRKNISIIFSFNQMFNNFGQVIGPFVGSAVVAGLGFKWVFYVVSAIVFCNLVWNVINFRHYLKVKKIS